ncbi:MAG: hypothetical protein PHO01_05385 [Desulfotomaculaceae bacterium]|nr:hypothetical protein [Desulfotomaculaceae bacterium]
MGPKVKFTREQIIDTAFEIAQIEGIDKEILISPINGVITSILYVAVGIGIRAYRRQSNN